MRIALKTAACLALGERKDEAAIEEALRWRRDALERDRRQLGDRPSEAAAQPGELRPANAR